MNSSNAAPFCPPLVKVSATGNDFLLVDLIERQNPWPSEEVERTRAQWVKLWCDRHEGIGADGAVFLEKSAEFDFVWDFYNSDGSSAEMCGNAARASCCYFASKFKKDKIRFRSQIGEIKAEIFGPGDVEVELVPVTETQWRQSEVHAGEKLEFDFINSGVPHAVVQSKDLENLSKLKSTALAVKSLKRFQSQGTNVTFLKPLATNEIECITFERGVEDFTLSCGTGALAAAYSFLHAKNEIASATTVKVKVPGGQLGVRIINERPYLRGPAKIIATVLWEEQCP